MIGRLDLPTRSTFLQDTGRTPVLTDIHPQTRTTTQSRPRADKMVGGVDDILFSLVAEQRGWYQRRCVSRAVDIGPQATGTMQSRDKKVNDETQQCPAEWIVKHRELLREKFPGQPITGCGAATGTLVRNLTGAADKEDINLHCAASQGLVDVVGSILAKGKTPCGLLDRYGRTALHWAAEQGHLLVTQVLLNTGANFETRCLQNRTPLMLAALGGHREVVCTMLKAGAGVTKQCNKLPRSIFLWKSTALHYAALGGHLGVVSTLLDAGFDKEQRNEAGLTPAEISARAARASSLAVTRRLLPSDMGARMVYDYVNMVMEDVETVAGLVKCGAFLDWQDGIGNSPLHRAAHFRHVNISKNLLQYGAETDLRNHRGGSPLHIAACQGSVAIATALLDAGADKEARMVNGHSPLHLAVINCNIGVVTLLVRNQAFTEHRDISRGQTPLSEAAEYGLAPTIRILLEAGADLESTSSEGLTPLHWACRYNHSTSVEVLLASGANPDVVDGAAAKAAKFMWTEPSETSPPVNAFELTASDVVGLGDPCRWNEDARRPFSGELESVAKQRLNLASRSKIMCALQCARKHRAWRRRGWLLVLANRQNGVDNAEDIITLTSKGSMQGSNVADSCTTGNYCTAAPNSKSYDSEPRVSQDWSVDGILCKKCRDATNYPQRVGSLRTMDMNGASHASDPPGMQRAPKRQHRLELGNVKAGDNSSPLVLTRGTIEALVGLASVELAVFRNVVSFI